MATEAEINMPASNSPAKAPRKYGFSCLNCRKRKIRCGGEKPTCTNCRGSLEHSCSYNKQQSTEYQLRLAQAQIQKLQEKVTSMSESGSHSGERNSDSSSVGRSHALLRNDDVAELRQSADQEENFWSEVSLDDKGSPQYHGSTSRFHIEVDKSETERITAGSKSSVATENDALQVLYSNSELLKRVWEPLAYATLPHDNEVPVDLATTLLQIYWTWQNPLHQCVYRPCFFRDMALGGPYFSKFLLMSIYAHAARHVNGADFNYPELDRGEGFLRKAKLLLLDELSELRPKIPTIQGLLILGGRQCSVGHSSEGWVYTGMAIRMLKDIGLHLNSEKLKRIEGLDPADLEARRRLYLSMYIWDKSISICLGRPPALREMPHDIDDIVDHFDDSNLWAPVIVGNPGNYPAQQSYHTMAFKEFLRLGKVISQIYSAIYDKQTLKTLEFDLAALETALERWFEKLPDVLKMKDPNSLLYCPPPHIFSLNLLYHTLFILIYRPFLQAHQAPEIQHHAQKVCSAQSVVINNLFILYGKTFDYDVMTYLVSYCVYTAATINVHDIKSSDPTISHEAAARLSVSLKVLESEAKQTPGIRRSVDIIKNQLRSWNRQDAAVGLMSQPSQQSDTNNMLPPTRAISSHYGVQGASMGSQFNSSGPLNLDNGLGMNVPVMTLFDEDFMDAGGGFQPNTFHWTLDDMWDPNVNLEVG